ncbi:MAG: hypothetical protein P0119_10725 [Nitrospira sp.]|nr:hypothetical protein [Nitrospira sp.]
MPARRNQRGAGAHRRVQAEGDQGLIHRGRGRPSTRRIAEPVKAKMRRLYEMRYGEFGPTLAAEKLVEQHGLSDPGCNSGRHELQPHAAGC